MMSVSFISSLHCVSHPPRLVTCTLFCCSKANRPVTGVPEWAACQPTTALCTLVQLTCPRVQHSGPVFVGLPNYLHLFVCRVGGSLTCCTFRRVHWQTRRFSCVDCLRASSCVVGVAQLPLPARSLADWREDSRGPSVRGARKLSVPGRWTHLFVALAP